jgi:hypothetical protein
LQQLLVQKIEDALDFGFQRGRNLHGLEQPAPKLRARGKLIVHVAQCAQIKNRKVLPETFEVHAPSRAADKRRAAGVEKDPGWFEAARSFIPGAASAKDDEGLARYRIGLDDLIKVLLKGLGPFSCLLLFDADFYRYTRRRFGVSIFVSEMNIVFGEAGAVLSPASRQNDPHRVEDSGLSGVVRADEDGRFIQLKVEGLDRTKV